jgi:hypothetical protein
LNFTFTFPGFIISGDNKIVKKILLFVTLPLLVVLSGCRKADKPLKERALEWIHSQIVPNTSVPSPSPDRRNLVISYEVPKNDKAYQYIYSRSSIYDNAVAAIAFLSYDQQSKAGDILEALSRLVNDDGSLFFSYNTHNSWPNQGDHEGAIIRSGALSWVGYATVFYLNQRLTEDPEGSKRSPRVKLLWEKSMAMADYILSQMVEDRYDERYGLVRGGYGLYELKYDPVQKEVIQPFIDQPVEWCSTEHNIDSYFFLRDLGRLIEDEKFLNAAERIRSSLLSKLWDDDLGQFIQGIKADGRLDKNLALDCTYWASMFLLSFEEENKAQLCLGTGSKYRNISGLGFKPYLGTMVYEDSQVNAFFFPSDPEKTWDSLDIVWFEGTLGMAAGYLKNGLSEQARGLIEGINRYFRKQKKGSLPYSTYSLPFQFNTYPSIASTSWYLIAKKMLDDENFLRRFCSK